jgi:hypothetical protein
MGAVARLAHSPRASGHRAHQAVDWTGIMIGNVFDLAEIPGIYFPFVPAWNMFVVWFNQF